MEIGQKWIKSIIYGAKEYLPHFILLSYSVIKLVNLTKCGTIHASRKLSVVDIYKPYGSNSPKREFTLINAHKPAAETTSNGHKKCNLKSVKG